VQHPHDGQYEFTVDPPPAGPETVRDGRPPRLLTGRPPLVVHAQGDGLVRRIAGPDLQRPELIDQPVEVFGLSWIG
jgi:hypothetical protein